MEKENTTGTTPLKAWLTATKQAGGQAPIPEMLKPISYGDVQDATSSFDGCDLLHHIPDSALTPDIVRWIQQNSEEDCIRMYLRQTGNGISIDKACSIMSVEGKSFALLPTRIRQERSVQMAAIAGCSSGKCLSDVLFDIKQMHTPIDEGHILTALLNHPEKYLLWVIQELTQENFTETVQTTMVQKLRAIDRSTPLFANEPPFLTPVGDKFFPKLYSRIFELVKQPTLRKKVAAVILDAFPLTIGIKRTIMPLSDGAKEFVSACEKDGRALFFVPFLYSAQLDILKAAIPNEEERALVYAQAKELNEDQASKTTAFDICEEFGVTLKTQTKRKEEKTNGKRIF